MWMAVEGFNLYLSFVKIADADIDHFILKSSVIAWGELYLCMISFALLCLRRIIVVCISCAFRRVQNHERAQNSSAASSDDSLFCSAGSIESGKYVHCLKKCTGKSM